MHKLAEKRKYESSIIIEDKSGYEPVSGIPEGSVVEISVTKPGMEKVTTNIRVQQSDLELINILKDLK